MKKETLKVVQCDSRGQIVIPQSIRKELNLEEGSAFWIGISKGDIVLKKIKKPE